MLNCKRVKQQGVILLVVMTMLVLFVLVAVAFVINASQAHRAAKGVGLARAVNPVPQREIRQALLELLRDTRNLNSSIKDHSILRDMYGKDGFRGTTGTGSALTSGAGGQFVDVPINSSAALTGTDGLSHSLSQTDGYYAGCVFTILEGPNRGVSVHIVDYRASAGVLVIPRFQTLAGKLASHTDFDGKAFLVNGRPFNGTGFGYNPTSGILDATTPDTNSYQYGRPFALLPRHHKDEDEVARRSLYLAGGADEDYDAPDHQNLFMAYVPPVPGYSGLIIPSFHRPSLVRYWLHHAGFGTALQQRTMFRPTRDDSSLFPYYSTAAEAMGGPWDVDNDGDGIADSVWVDLGFPAATTPDGRIYRPLFSFLCVDLDGKLNVNAHNNPMHLSMLDAKEKPIPEYLAGVTNAVNSNSLPAGQGVGTAEINLKHLYGAANSDRLMQGGIDAATGLYMPGVYGNEKVKILPISLPPTSTADGSVPGYAGYDLLAQSQTFDYPPNYYLSGNAGNWNAFSSQSDLLGQFAVGVRYRGQPVYERSYLTDLRINSPYELNLSRDASRGLSGVNAADMPFTPGELERLLRAFDVDSSSLPDRLWRLLNLSSDSDFLKKIRLTTTDSYDLPSPNVMASLDDRKNKSLPRNVIDLLRRRLILGMSFTEPLTSTQENTINTSIAQLLSFDLRRGLRMDINRPFGNGVDNDNDGVVDDSGIVGAAGEDSDQLTYPHPVSSQTVAFNYTNNNSGIGNSLQARQLFAKHLYVLMMLLTEPTAKTADEAHEIAQWAVNVVDFRDADSIMTQFRYDPTPFGTGGYVESKTAWGCERPELLISETLVFHDRRTEDLAFTDGGTDNKKTDDPTTPDMHFDQEKRPTSGVFLELYNPWTNGDPLPGGLSAIAGDPNSGATRPKDRNPAEFYRANDGTWSNGVLLNKVTPNGSDPVWRIIVAKGTQGHLDPDHPDSAQQLPSSSIERSFYFTNLATISKTSGIGADGETYYSTATSQAPLLPGRYAVVGSSGTEAAGAYTTYIGERADGDNTQTRRLVLTPSTNVATNQFVVHDNTESPPTPTHDPVVAIPINAPRSASVTEPVSGYTATGWNAGAQKYVPPLDVPLDTGLLGGDGDQEDFKDYATFHLQRLANPLHPYHATNNPYLTVDSMSANLTAFNGSDAGTDPSIVDGNSENTNFVTLERGYRNNGTGGLNKVNLWGHEPAYTTTNKNPDPSLLPTAGGGNHNFDYNLQHTLGHLNRYYVHKSGMPARAWNDARDPGIPFPWLAWYNRPLATHLELMQVPRSRSSRLLFDFTMLQPGNPYSSGTSQFGHLLNFFGNTSTSAHYYRLFEFVNVPSRFVGTDMILDPTTFRTTGSAGTNFLHPPFNRLSWFRDPGRVNINTIANPLVWDAILDGHDGPTWAELVTARRGYGTSSPNQFLADNSFPSLFSSPFRGYGADELYIPLDTSKGGAADRMKKSGNEASLLRSSGSGPFFKTIKQGQHDDPARNSFSNYQGLQRTGNLLTTRSNVYAVWITVGYFGSWADGTLHHEIGKETGQIKRHRAFFMLDRSIPVAFEPGEDHNVENCILIQRFIE